MKSRKKTILSMTARIVAVALCLMLPSCNDLAEDADRETTADTVQTTDSVDMESDLESTDEITEAKSETETQIDTESENATVKETETETDTTAETETETTECYHPYDANEEGHWKVACDICGKGKGRIQSHNWETRLEDGGDLYVYKVFCTYCKYVGSKIEVPYSARIFISPGDLIMRTVSGIGQNNFEVKGGHVYSDMMSSGEGQIRFFAYSSTASLRTSGRYLVIKAKLGDITELSLSLKSTAAEGGVEVVARGLYSEWSLLLIDMTSIVNGQNGYTPDSYGNHFLNELVLSITSPPAAGESVSFSYLMTFNKLEEALEVFEREEGYYRYDDMVNENFPEAIGRVCNHNYVPTGDGCAVMDCDVCGMEGGEIEEHSYGVVFKGDSYKYSCGKCNYALVEKNVPQAAELYYTPVDINTQAFSYYNIEKGGIDFDLDSSTLFARYLATDDTGDRQILFTRDRDVDDNLHEIEVGNSRYLVVKVRSSKKDSQTLRFNIKTDGQSSSHVLGHGTDIWIPLADTNAGEWATYVIDLQTAAPDSWKPDGDGNYTVDTFFFHIIGRKISKATDYIDIAYFAFCRDWDQIKKIVDEDSVRLCTAASGSSISKSLE